MSDKPIVSVITPAYNAEKYIAETIKSVQGQSFGQWELIVVDDASSDATVQIVQKFVEQDERIKLFANPENIGQGLTRNKAIEIAQGRYIAFLDSDDVWAPSKLEKQVSALQLTGAAMSHTSYDFIDGSGNQIKGVLEVSPNPIDYNHLLQRTEIGCLTAIYDTELVGKRYMPDLPRSQDYALWLDILYDSNVSVPIQEVLAHYRVHGENISKNKWVKVPYHWKVIRSQKNMTLPKSVYLTGIWAIRGFTRYFLK